MGQTVNATEAAELLGISERSMRARLAVGKIPGARKVRAVGKAAHWAIDTDALASLPGVTLDRDALALLEAKSRRAPGGVLARLDALEAQVRALSARLRALENAPGAPSSAAIPSYSSLAFSRRDSDETDGAPASVSGQTFAALPRPRPLQFDALAVATVGDTFRTRADAARWLMRHGVNERTPKSWPGWREVDMTPAAVLRLAISLYDPTNWRIPWRLHRCDAAECVCHELLDEGVAR